MPGDEFMKAINEEMKLAYQDMAKDAARDIPWLTEYVNQREAVYAAYPWYKKKWIRLRSNWLVLRQKVGYWIAGYTPSDDY